MAENMKINNVSPTKNCNICRCLLFGSNGVERCQKCIEVHGMTGIPIILTSDNDKTPELGVPEAVKKLEAIAKKRKMGRLQDTNLRKDYEDALNKSISYVWGYDMEYIKEMTFEDREELAKILYANCHKRKDQFMFISSVSLGGLSGLISSLFKLNIYEFAFVMLILSLVIVIVKFFRMSYLRGRSSKMTEEERMIMCGVLVDFNFKSQYEKFH